MAKPIWTTEELGEGYLKNRFETGQIMSWVPGESSAGRVRFLGLAANAEESRSCGI